MTYATLGSHSPSTTIEPCIAHGSNVPAGRRVLGVLSKKKLPGRDRETPGLAEGAGKAVGV